ncbi:MAG: cyclomaltodextrinase N-terminal domain-containing protein, partial [Bacteroidota bacterium]
MRLLATSLLLFLYLANYAQTINLDRIEPPFWWAGMEQPHLELLIHGENISAARASISAYPGVSLQSEVRLENPNYLILNLHIGPEAAPGEVRINFQTIGGNFTIAYQLKEREGFDNRIQGVTSEDLIYLIMPDRFANGDPTNDAVEGMFEAAKRTGTYVRHGGDLKGIQNRLDYL